MRAMQGGSWGACLGAIVWALGCASGEQLDTGAPPATMTQPATSAAASTGEPTPMETTGTTAEGTTGESATADATTAELTAGTTTDPETTTTGPETTESSTTGAAVCGNGIVEGDEECDDGNQIETDACLSDCYAAVCGDGFVQEGVEECDDANAVETDACLITCVAAKCGDGFVQEGVEECDDGNVAGGDGCDASCKVEPMCGNPGGGNLAAENGTGMGKMYCYNQGDSVEVRARKACESHFGVGACCVITGGYQDQQYGKCGDGGGTGTVHFHFDNHPANHCAPYYVVGDVVSQGWCGSILGNFLD